MPHPKSRQDDHRNGGKSNNGGVIGNLFERTINITDDRNAENQVNPAKNRTLGGIRHDRLLIVASRRARDHGDKLFEHLRPAELRTPDRLFAERLRDVKT